MSGNIIYNNNKDEWTSLPAKNQKSKFLLNFNYLIWWIGVVNKWF